MALVALLQHNKHWNQIGFSLRLPKEPLKRPDVE